MHFLRRYNPKPKQISKKESYEEFAELIRLVPPNTPESQYFQTQMEILIQKLFPKINLVKKPVQFSIFDDNEINAFFTMHFQLPLIAFSKGFLKEVKFFEDLAGFLGHEFTHMKFAEKYGKEHRNTKLEELSADIWPLILITEAKMDPREYVNFIRKVHFGKLNKKILEESIAEVIDVHPTGANRIRILEDGLAIIDTKIGGLADRLPEPLPPDFHQKIKNAKHFSYIDIQLMQNNYSNLTTIEKIEFLDKLTNETKHWNLSRINDLNHAIRILKIRRSNVEERKIQDRFANDLLTIASTDPTKLDLVRLIYQSLTSSLSIESEDIRPIGRLKLYEDAIYAFIEAEKFSDAVSAAKNFLNLLNNESLNLPFLRQLVTWPIFKVPSMRRQKKKLVPWNKHIDWVSKDNSESILHALLALGVIDQRLFEIMSPRLETLYREKKLKLLLTPLIVDDQTDLGDPTENTIDRYEIDEDGFLIPRKRTQEIREPTSVEILEEEKNIEDQLRQIEKDFLKITPGDVQAENQLIQFKANLFGSIESTEQAGALNRVSQKPSVLRNQNAALRYHWVALKHAEHNFRLFLALNTDIFPELSPISDDYDIIAKHFVKKLTQLAFSGQLDFIKFVRQLYFGFPADSPLFSFSFTQNMISGFVLPLSDEWSSSIIDFIIDNPNKIFNSNEQIFLLNKMIDADQSLKQLETKSLSPKRLEKYRNFFNYEAPKNAIEYLNTLEYFQLKKSSPTSQALDPVRELREATAITAIYGLKNLLTSEASLIRAMMLIELRILIYENKMSHFNLDRFITLMDGLHLENFSDLKKYFRPLIRKKIWPTDIPTLTDQWIKLYHADLFPSDQILCYQILKRALSKIADITNLKQQGNLYEALLFKQHLKDPRIRKKLETLWVKNIKQQLNFDDKTKKYAAQVQRLLERMRSDLNLNDRIFLTAKLADRLQTQEKLTLQCKNMLEAFTKSELEGSLIKGIILEAALLKIKKTDNGRKQLIEFLTHPFSVDQIHKILETEAYDALFDYKEIAGVPVKIKIPNKRIKAELKFLWENFWATPFAIRAILFEQLLFPEVSEESDIIQSIFDYVKDQLFPLNEKYSLEARLFLDAYFTVIPAYQHRILLSAMMVTAEQNNEKKLGIGQRLAIVLELLGPAETKLGQVIHSHPKTPPEIREGMGRLKNKADPPFRWDLLDYYKTSVPANIRQNVSHIDKLLGSASFYLALGATKKNINGVFKILRPFALARAENGFKIMLNMLRLLSETFAPSIIETLKQMIEQANENAKLETNFEISKQQTELAIQMYDQKQISLNNEIFTLYVPKIIDSGSTYQFIERAPGKHFNDLPEKTTEEIVYKKKIALVYIFFELFLILRGNRFDSDRHGAQCRIVDNNIYLFDWGGMNLHPPTITELQQLGETLFDILMEVQMGINVEDAITKVIQQRINIQDNIQYLLSVQKALLSLEDFRQYLELTDLFQILAILLKSNIHEAILSAFLQKAFVIGVTLEQLQTMLDQFDTKFEIHLLN